MAKVQTASAVWAFWSPKQLVSQDARKLGPALQVRTNFSRPYAMDSRACVLGWGGDGSQRVLTSQFAGPQNDEPYPPSRREKHQEVSVFFTSVLSGVNFHGGRRAEVAAPQLSRSSRKLPAVTCGLNKTRQKTCFVFSVNRKIEKWVLGLGEPFLRLFTWEPKGTPPPNAC